MILIRWWQQHDVNERMPLNMISMQLNKSASRDQCCIEDNVDGDCGDGDGGDGEYIMDGVKCPSGFAGILFPSQFHQPTCCWKWVGGTNP